MSLDSEALLGHDIAGSMGTPKVIRYFVATLVVPLLLLAGSGRTRATFRCAADAITRAACCCPEAPRAEGEQDAFTRSCCCEIAMVEAAELGAVRPEGPQQDLGKLHAVLIVAFVAVPEAPVAPWARTLHREGDPPAGPPLLLVKQSFLI